MTITTNDELQKMAETAQAENIELYAVRHKDYVSILTSKRSFNNMVEKYLDAPNGPLTATNWVWFRL